MIYHVEPVTIRHGKLIKGLYQIHTQEAHDLKWDFKAIVSVAHNETVLDVEGHLNVEEKLMVLDRTAHLRSVS